ncbi:Na+/H+ antiporter NhaC family protein [Lactobacillus sp. ESL0731]|uniref:Na+/H+ antiporter NhaC family protein n=1 Tax=unclassified Lactobacillus TaxID=2620435 RepID=UPI0023F7B96A|nr:MULTISPECIES: Na+/H+ antiporter NhaC family protein [unclassified Lactobacillus]WEV50315.1 Na+/H+ antiporter NhaC family protein [Lactobacillus sp. ESL0700]WEV61444.1 Na+/H+ antiporter NhaC family protein [Lactobacillus sp. ESL0731]
MNEKKELSQSKSGSFMGLMPLIVFLILYALTGFITGKFDSMPLLVGMIIASMVSFALTPPKGTEKQNFDQKVMTFCKGGGEPTLIMMVVIFILAGAFQGVATKMHAVSSITNLGLSLLPSQMILPGIFVIGCILSFAMGTSMGTVAALMPVAVDVAVKTGVNPALMAGIVVGGAMFGDNNSFISATAIASAQTQGVMQREKFKLNIITYLPALVINIILLAIYPIKTVSMSGSYSYNLVDIIPYLLVIILSLVGMNVMPVMIIGVLSGIVIGIIHGDFSLIGSMTYVQSGMAGMEDMSIIAIFVGGLVEVMKYLGGIQWLMDKLGKETKTKRGAEFSIGMLVTLLCVATTNNTIAIITVAPLAEEIGHKFHLARSRVATLLSMYATHVQGLIPYAGQLLVAGAMAKVSPVSIMPWVWYCYLTLICSILFVIFDFPRVKVTPESGYDNFETKTTDKVSEATN